MAIEGLDRKLADLTQIGRFERAKFLHGEAMAAICAKDLDRFIPNATGAMEAHKLLMQGTDIKSIQPRKIAAHLDLAGSILFSQILALEMAEHTGKISSLEARAHRFSLARALEGTDDRL